MSFANLKKNQGLEGMKMLQNELEKLGNKGEGSSNDDDKYWRLTTDKSGVGAAVIRFLPAADGDSLPFITIFEHAFQGPGGWYIEKSRTTLGKHEKDPVYEYNNQLWNSGIDANKELARKQKRTSRYVSNILVIKDPANPENEGKVFLYKYGKKIFQKIQESMFPESDLVDSKEAINPFCPWKGANFKVKVKRVEGYPNYDQSEFGRPDALFDGDDAKIEAVWKQQTRLEPLIAPSEFKSYDDLKKRLDRVLGLSVNAQPTTSPKTPRPSLVETVSEDTEVDVTTEETTDLSDDLSYLQQLANEE